MGCPRVALSVFGPLARFGALLAPAISRFNLDSDLRRLPALYELTLTNQDIHVSEYHTFMAFAAINWWPVIAFFRWFEGGGARDETTRPEPPMRELG